MGHWTKENCLFSEQKVMFDRSWKLKLLSAHSEFLIYMVKHICSRTKYAIMKKIEGTRFFLGRFEILKKRSFHIRSTSVLQ